MINYLDIQRGYDAWAAKPHNAKWVRKIDGTPIANDIVACIWEYIREDVINAELSTPPAEPVGYVSKYDLDEVAEGRMAHIAPAGTFRPENEIPLYSTPPAEPEDIRAALQPRAWFVKDFADGWIHFDNESDARREIEATGALMLVAYPSRLIDKPEAGEEVGTTRKDCATLAKVFEGWLNAGRQPTFSAGDMRHIIATLKAAASASPLSAGVPQAEPVAWRVRVKSDDPEEWFLLPAGGGADYLDREGYECQPLYTASAPALSPPLNRAHEEQKS